MCQWVHPVNLRFRNILTKDTHVPSAIATYVLEAENLVRFIRGGRVPTVDDIWILARELNAQMDEQSPETKSVARWGEVLEFASLPPELLQRLQQ